MAMWRITRFEAIRTVVNPDLFFCTIMLQDTDSPLSPDKAFQHNYLASTILEEPDQIFDDLEASGFEPNDFP